MIQCVYCGAQHETAAEVRACWQGSSEAPGTSPHQPRPNPPATTVDSTTAAPNRPPVRVAPIVASTIRSRGPACLGRNAIVAAGDEAPPGWSDAPRIAIGPSQLADPGPTVDALTAARLNATSVVIEIDDSLAGRWSINTPPDEVERRELFEIGPGFRFMLDELHALCFANSFDGRDGQPVDDSMPDAWIDYGPLRYLPPSDGVAIVPACSVHADGPHAPLGNTTDDELAADQVAAVTHPGGTARIIAPAGSGKTRVLTARARHLLTQWQLRPDSICLVAFNKRAQEEMEQRTAELGGLSVRTLNALALAIINGQPPFAPQKRRWRTITEPDVRRLLEPLVKVPRRLNVDPMSTWIDALSAIRLGMRDPHIVEADYGGDVPGLAGVYPRYVAALERDGAVDFDHQIVKAVEVLLTQPAARRDAQAACSVLLVDEFQDLTPAHLLLIRLVSGPLGSVFGVGDDDQTIYGYNGADPAWLIDFATWFPGAGDHPLQVNYRCPAGIVEAVDRLLRHNLRRVPKTILAGPNAAAGGWSDVQSGTPVQTTVATVTEAIGAGTSTSEIAVLARVNTSLAPVQIALAIEGVPVAGGVGTDYVERASVRAAFAWLRLAESDRFAPSDIAEALRRPSRRLHPRIRDWATEQGSVDDLRRLADRLTTDNDAQRMHEFADDLEAIRRVHAQGGSSSAVVTYLVDDIGLGTAMASLDSGRHGTNRSAQNDDLQAFAQIADLYDRSGDGPFEPWLRRLLATPRSRDGVTLSTVHRVKGQEWPIVVVHLADDDQFPHRLAEDVEEERRLFHVALTRASSFVTVVSGPRPSPFIAELTTEPAPITERAQVVVDRSTSARSSSRPAKASAHPLTDRETVLAVEGLVLIDQGQEWEITEIQPDAAVASRGSATRRFELGTKVATVGGQRGRLSPRPGSVEPTAALAFDRLRQMRDRLRNGKPAYVVFDDKTLAAIADADPADAEELARVRGVGPAKLATYGDDVLEVVAEARAEVT